MKSLMMLWLKLADEMANELHTSAAMDCKTVQARVKHEGLEFLTLTLPTFGKAFELWLDQGQVDRSLYTSFRYGGGLPRFMSGFLGRVFDTSSGVLLDEPDTYAILCIRQLTLMFAKIDLPCSDARTIDAYSDYIRCEQELASNEAAMSSQEIESFRRISMLLFRESFTYADKKICDGEVVPKHGPGSTADGYRGNAKYAQRIWTNRLERYFPAMEFLFPSASHYDWENNGGVQFLEPENEIPVKVISVPKTQKTPRIIAMEPTAVQYVQQGILEVLLEGLRRHDFPRRFLGFKDQTPNQRMALDGSRDGDLATLDLSEASDRVSYRLVQELTHRFPHLHEAIDATRSRKADVPGYGIRSLSKFASMGSALCFPVEAMVFLTIIFIGIERELRTSLDRKTIQSFLGRVRVYGDDIIVPVEYVHTVIESLEAFGFKVNSNKSFWTGKFRESCGKEYYNGTDVSIVRVRQMFPTSRQDAPAVISLVSLRNQLYWAGHWRTVEWLDTKIKKMIHHFPVVLGSSPVLGRESVLGYETQRTHSTLHAPLVKGLVVKSRLPHNEIEGSDALLKVFHLLHRREISRDSSRFPHLYGEGGNEEHLVRSGRPQSVFTKLGWFSPF